ncbi:MAG: sigma-70 family RNA polymerase sigma factor [Clostridium perfringens]|uniref:sigma-70 family RNA polymerase sigma factor n=1 Tax=Clostridium perfringens TaxID=1502 RepID=UPI0018E4C43A|nr:sigma-70 family RNA polymerase sigma factor [Clostridium perfringens]ELC8423300.1 sigma-70 family RNA polymerase sigma factor [Clostridium perfringens]ELC8451580.1 sigma-70 family RNA polymerase sigma factor [Clostridium perfringens]MBI6069230.1 sigma-70 family RNA polymerase sigma factor [Clostridium perfringens]MBI6097521.1 sigma-70 family RNA polymerase sigma factor [Clostridium perfringens]MCI5750048.1 sigma-70 family RNA polymerase sigma factor [Clostridium perfringens]
MSKLYENIVLFQQKRDKNAMEYIINKFEILIDRYKMSFLKEIYFNKYDVEDNKQDLIVSLINIVNKIPIEYPQFDENEGCLVNYIYKAILNSRKDMYINKNIKRDFIENKYLSSVVEFEDNYFVKDIESNIEIEDMLKCLTEKEKRVIKYKVLNDKSENEIAKILKISRKSVNKMKNRALKKLKENI